MRFENMGIPVGYVFKQLLFSSAANTLVLQACSASESWRPERLYFRHIEEDQYRPIGVPHDLVSQESPFVHSSKPLLAFISNQHKFIVDGEDREGHYADWCSLTILNLEDGSEIQSVDDANLQLPTGTKHGWICGIVAFGDSGLFVKAALSKSESFVEYFIAELDATMSLKPVTALPAVFM